MRAKMRVTEVKKYGRLEGVTESIILKLNAVGKNGNYPADGSDEDNTFSRWTPSAELVMSITNPNLLDSFEVGQTYYIDFTQANSKNELKAIDVLKIIRDRAQSCREEGDSDMRNILYMVDFLKREISSGKSREEILNQFIEGEE